MIAKALRLLVVEDVEDHALLIVRELTKGGFAPTFTRVETLDGLKAALADHVWDAVISDFRLPGFNALDALRHFKTCGQDIPFILVSGVIGEEMAAEVMRAGAHGYIMKGNYARLALTLERELREAAVRRERRETAENLTIYRERLEALVAGQKEQLERAHRALEAEKNKRKAAERQVTVLKALLREISAEVMRLSRQASGCVLRMLQRK